MTLRSSTSNLARAPARKSINSSPNTAGKASGCEKQILYGKRVYEILNFAAEHGVDLIIMSSHKLDPENVTEGWGTISFKVGVLSHCPVMLVK